MIEILYAGFTAMHAALSRVAMLLMIVAGDFRRSKAVIDEDRRRRCELMNDTAPVLLSY